MKTQFSIGIVLGIFIGFMIGTQTCKQEVNQVIETLGSECTDALSYHTDHITLLNNQLK